MLVNRERALEVMERHDLDALVVTRPENVFYFSDYGASHLYSLEVVGIAAAIFPRDESLPATLIVLEFEIPYLAERPTWMPEVRMIAGLEARIPPDGALTPDERRIADMWDELRSKPSSSNRQELIAVSLQEMGLTEAKLGFDDLRVMAELVEGPLKGSQSREAINIIREIRVVKTPEEITILRRAARVNEVALASVISLALEGTSVGELQRSYRAAMATQGGTGVEIPLGGGDRPWQVLFNPSYILKEGDHLNVDVAGKYENYWCDTGRTVCIGAPTPRVTELFSAIAECHAAVVPMISAGRTAIEIVSRATEVVRGAMPTGFCPVLHSIGVEVYDQPSTYGAIYGDDFALEANMVLNFESLYFEWGWGALQLENSYLVGSGGPERLTALPDGPLWVDAQFSSLPDATT